MSARQLVGSAESYELLVAAVLLTAVRANRMAPAPPTETLRAVLDTCADLPTSVIDRDLTVDIDIARNSSAS